MKSNSKINYSQEKNVKGKTGQLYAIFFANLEVKHSPRAKFSQFLIAEPVGPRSRDTKLPHHFQISLPMNLILTWVSSSLQVPPSTSSFQWPHFSWTFYSLSWSPNTRPRRYLHPTNEKSMAQKSGRQFFGMDVRGITTSLEYHAKNGYNLDEREILN